MSHPDGEHVRTGFQGQIVHLVGNLSPVRTFGKVSVEQRGAYGLKAVVPGVDKQTYVFLFFFGPAHGDSRQRVRTRKEERKPEFDFGFGTDGIVVPVAVRIVRHPVVGQEAVIDTEFPDGQVVAFIGVFPCDRFDDSGKVLRG